MKKFLVLFLLFVSFYVFAETNTINLTEGKENLGVLKDVEAVSILYTFDGTKMWDTDFDNFLLNRKKRGKFAAEDKVKIINELKKVTQNNLGMGKKFGLKVIDKKEDAKDGLIFVINYDKCVSAPPMGAKSYATLTAYSVSEPDNVLFKGEMMATLVSTWIGDALPEGQFSNMGRVFARVVIAFLNDNK
jgi:hypothetical protein